MNVYDFKDYRSYLLSVLGDKTQRRGLKSQAAQYVGCHTTVISQVLNGKIDLSLEQAEKFTRFLNLSEDEEHYFLLMVQKSRSGTKALQSYFQKQIDHHIELHMDMKKRMGRTELVPKEVSQIYYSSWIYAAIHIALTVPEFRDPFTLARKFGVPETQVLEVLDFLMNANLAVKEKGAYKVGPKHIHLSAQSPYIFNHHRNWRLRALQNFELKRKEDLHYSSAISLSKDDVFGVKESLIEHLKSVNKLIGASKEEEVYALNFDFFKL